MIEWSFGLLFFVVFSFLFLCTVCGMCGAAVLRDLHASGSLAVVFAATLNIRSK